MRKISNIILFLIILSACNGKKKEELNNTLNSAGNNKQELVKVLNYYKSTDSLKYEAAKYLISNMHGHYSSSKLVEEIPVHKAIFEEIDYQAKNHYNFELTKTKPKVNVNFIKFATRTTIEKIINRVTKEHIITGNFGDELEIKADWLIKHVDSSFIVWKNSNLAKNMNFEEFKQTILPYRYDNKEQLKKPVNFHTKLLRDFIVNDSVKSLNDIISRFNFYLTKVRFLTDSTNFKEDLGFYNVLKWEKLSCEQQSNWATNALNDCGIPTEIHFTPNWLNRIGGHSWCASRNKEGVYKPFSPQWQKINDTVIYKRASKVYKKTYVAQKDSPALLKQETETVPDILNSPYIKDVSEQYHKVVNLKIPCDTLLKTSNLAYLAIFTSKAWEVVAWGEVDDVNLIVNFKKVPVKATYIFGWYINGVFKPFGAPFYINNEGQKKDFRANYNTKEAMVLYEKYPQKDDLKKWLAPIINSKFTGANKRDFSDEKILYQLKKMPEPIVNQIEVKDKTKFKYARFVTEKNALSYLSILEFFKKRDNNESINIGTKPYITKIEDTVLLKSLKKYTKLKDISRGWRKNDTRANCLDSNIETYTNSRWVGLEFETPQTIEQIRFAFRTANNRINSGDTYKLSFYDNGWKTHRIHKAKYNFLSFNGLPSNTIYWLSNLTKGIEELPFIYINNKQVFVNHDDIEQYFKN